MNEALREGAIPSLTEQEVLGTPNHKQKRKTNATKFLVLSGILLGLTMIIFGLVFFKKGMNKNEEEKQKTPTKQEASYKERNAPVQDTNIEKLKAEIRKKAEEDAANHQANASAKYPQGQQSEEQTPESRKMSGTGFLMNNDGSIGGGNNTGTSQNGYSPTRATDQESSEISSRMAQLGIGQQASEPNMATRLKPTLLESTQAKLLPNEDYLLRKGTKIPCALEGGIDTTLPGFISCKTIGDTYSSNGSTLLIGRGDSVFGEQNSSLKQGQARTFVAWNRIDTNGISINIDSPSSDQMGYSGIPGEVDTHFGARFGGALMVSMIRDASQAATQRNSNNSGPTYNNTTSTAGDMTSEALRNSVNIPPTLRVLPGTVIHITVARDVSFENVYSLIK